MCEPFVLMRDNKLVYVNFVYLSDVSLMFSCARV